MPENMENEQNTIIGSPGKIAHFIKCFEKKKMRKKLI